MQEEVRKSVDQLIAMKRRCIAGFMDENTDTFGTPLAGLTWADVLLEPAQLSEVDRRKVSKALGMLTATLRTAQSVTGDGPSLAEALSPQREPAVEALPPDAAALAVVGGGDDENSIAFARCITIYKVLMEAGQVTEDKLRRILDGVLESLPGSSPLMRSVIETTRRMTQLDLDYMFGTRH